jgi:predicted DNA-binding antitoxin AbrB/MazE fold protein
MLEIINTVYRNGVFAPQQPVDFPEGAEVEIFIQKHLIADENISDDERKNILAKLIREMRERTLSPEVSEKLTYEELHEKILILKFYLMLRTGVTCDNQTISSVLEDVAVRTDEDCWKLKSGGQQKLFDFI